jgi:outer membrane receptor for Fe3+-dicitrate
MPRVLLLAALLCIGGCAGERIASPRAGNAPRVRLGQDCGTAGCPQPALVMLDGRRYPGPVAATPLARLDVDRIAHLEVVRGPEAVRRFGPGTEAGVLVVTTRAPAS